MLGKTPIVLKLTTTTPPNNKLPFPGSPTRRKLGLRSILRPSPIPARLTSDSPPRASEACGRVPTHHERRRREHREPLGIRRFHADTIGIAITGRRRHVDGSAEKSIARV